MCLACFPESSCCTGSCRRRGSSGTRWGRRSRRPSPSASRASPPPWQITFEQVRFAAVKAPYRTRVVRPPGRRYRREPATRPCPDARRRGCNGQDAVSQAVVTRDRRPPPRAAHRGRRARRRCSDTSRRTADPRGRRRSRPTRAAIPLVARGAGRAGFVAEPVSEWDERSSPRKPLRRECARPCRHRWLAPPLQKKSMWTTRGK